MISRINAFRDDDRDSATGKCKQHADVRSVDKTDHHAGIVIEHCTANHDLLSDVLYGYMNPGAGYAPVEADPLNAGMQGIVVGACAVQGEDGNLPLMYRPPVGHLGNYPLSSAGTQRRDG